MVGKILEGSKSIEFQICFLWVLMFEIDEIVAKMETTKSLNYGQNVPLALKLL